MPRALAAGFALTAVLASIGLVAAGAVCGIQSTRGDCTADGCAPPVSGCTPYVDPLLWGALASSLAALAAVALGWHAPALALAVVAAGSAAYLGSPRMDPEEYFLLGLLLLSGLAMPTLARWRDHLLGLAAIVAVAVPLVMVPFLYDLMPQSGWGKLRAPPEGALQVVAFLPMALWLVFVAWDALRPRRRAAATA